MNTQRIEIVRDPNLYVDTLINPVSKQCELEKVKELFVPEDIPLIFGLRPSKSYKSDGYRLSFMKLKNHTVRSGY